MKSGRCSTPELPLAAAADTALAALARATGSAAIAALDGATLLGERAALAGFRIPARTAAGGGCRLFDAADGTIALSLARPDDRATLPALLAAEIDPSDDAAVARRIAATPAHPLVARGRLLGLAIAAEVEAAPPPPAITPLAPGRPALRRRTRPRVLDLSALWAGPLAGHLLALAGADVVKVESRRRPDGARGGDPPFFARLNQRKASVVLDLASPSGIAALEALIRSADIVIEAARPRALRQLGVEADALVAAVPGLTWITLTAHGIEGDAADWIGFGDDVGVAAGLSAALRRATGASGFVGDAVADPLAGIAAATAAWAGWRSGAGGRIGVAMRGVVAAAIAGTPALDDALRGWHAAQGRPFPAVPDRATGAVAAFGADTDRILAAWPRC